MFSFSKLQAAMSRLRFKDESALRSLGLAKLSRTFDIYPIIEDGQKIFVLLPRDMDPSVAQRLEAQAAAKSVVVLAQLPEGVTKVWPNVSQPIATKAAPKVTESKPADVDFEIVEE